VKLFKKTASYSINQGLIQKKIGFQNLRNFFSKMGINIFLLARKDMNYLRAYKRTNKELNALFYGGYTFLIYVENEKIKLNSMDNNIADILNPFINYYKLFVLKEGIESLSLKAVNFAKIYPLLIKFTNNYYTTDVIKNYINFFFKILVKNVYHYHNFEEIIKKEKVLRIIENNMKLSTNINIYELTAKTYIAGVIPVILNQQINKMKFLIYKLHVNKTK
jgi:hypothetical protein